MLVVQRSRREWAARFGDEDLDVMNGCPCGIKPLRALEALESFLRCDSHGIGLGFAGDSDELPQRLLGRWIFDVDAHAAIIQ